LGVLYCPLMNAKWHLLTKFKSLVRPGLYWLLSRTEILEPAASAMEDFVTWLAY
jgi:hypothetical protein